MLLKLYLRLKLLHPRPLDPRGRSELNLRLSLAARPQTGRAA